MGEPPAKMQRLDPPDTSGGKDKGGSYNAFAEKMMVGRCCFIEMAYNIVMNCGIPIYIHAVT